MTRVLVTGANGFIGRYVTAALSANGVEVHAVTSADPRTWPEGDIVWHRADLLDGAAVRALLAAVRADSLVHLAWTARPPDYWRDPDNLRWAAATLEMVRAFADAGGSRVVGVGSCAEYDWRHGLCTERFTPLAATTLYGAAKGACGTLLQAYGEETGLSLAWARLFFLFGPHDAATRLVPSLVLKLRAGESVTCTSGSHVRDFLFVADAAAALVALLGSTVTGPVNVASGAPIRIAELAHGVAERLGCPSLLRIEPGAPQHTVVAASIDRLRDEVGWQPPTRFAEALDETVRWWAAADAGALS